jgi:serine/threonine protein kinase
MTYHGATWPASGYAGFAHVPQHLDVGQIIAGKYELVRLLGRGTSSAVWAVRHTSLDEIFALKVLTPPPDVAPELASARFHEQAQVSAALSRKTRHVVSVTDHGEEGGWPYFVMELLEGETLEVRLRRGTIDAAATADMLGQVARALSVAHAMGVLHGNLLPANLFLCKDEDERPLVKLLDFGLARPGEPSPAPAEVISEASPDGDPNGEIEVQRFAVTTSPYASPEQVRGDAFDHRCDLWAAVVIAYRCLTGTFPWGGASVEEVVAAICTNQWIPARDARPDLPYVVEAFFARGFAFGVDERFQTAKEVAATFRAAFPHTGRAEGGRAAFASRPDVSDEIGAAPGREPTSTKTTPATTATTPPGDVPPARRAASNPPPKATPPAAPAPPVPAPLTTPRTPPRWLLLAAAVAALVATVAFLAARSTP